jgi:hypothetical protein
MYQIIIGSALQHVRLPNLSLNHESEIEEIKSSSVLELAIL